MSSAKWYVLKNILTIVHVLSTSRAMTRVHFCSNKNCSYVRCLLSVYLIIELSGAKLGFY